MYRANKLSRACKRLLMRSGLARVRTFGRDQNGATAVEFAIVSVPFFALMFAILETALVFFGAQALETAVGTSGRLIRTGQAQQQAMNAEAFKDTICDQVFQIFDCADGLKLDVRTYASFAAMSFEDPIDEDGNLDTEDFDFDVGESNEIVVVRAYYEWPTFVTGLGTDLRNLSNGKHLISSAAAFRNEPFPW
jgi:Flp pilus assembly protein TadG